MLRSFLELVSYVPEECRVSSVFLPMKKPGSLGEGTGPSFPNIKIKEAIVGLSDVFEHITNPHGLILELEENRLI